MQPPGYRGSEPVGVRIGYVGAGRFVWQLDEWNYSDGRHTTETMSFLVLEAGRHTWGEADVEAGMVEGNTGWRRVDFSEPFASAPVVLAQVQTRNGSDAVTVRLRNVTTTGFEVRLQEEQAGGGHTTETIGYVAVEQGAGTAGRKFIAGTSGNAVTDAWRRIGFSKEMAEPVFLAGVQSYDGSDPVRVRYRNLTASGAEVFAQEEQSADSETSHTSEEVGYLIFEGEGLLGRLEYTALDGAVALGDFGDGGVLRYWNVVLPSGAVVGRVLPNGDRRYYLKDRLGSVRAVVDPSRPAGDKVVETRDYYPFGLRMGGRSLTSGDWTREGYTGHELDRRTGLHYAGARYYMSAFGRWTTVDPLADDYPAWSPYNYSLNSSVLRFPVSPFPRLSGAQI